MLLAEEQKIVTPEELLTLNGDALYELVDGKLVRKNMGAISSRVGFVIARILDLFCIQHNLGVVMAETTFQCFPQFTGRVRIPDVAFIAVGRLSGGNLPEGHVLIAPDLAIEVISPHDKAYDVDHKVGEYFSAGVRMVWTVNPKERLVRVHRLNGGCAELRGDAEISGEDVLPGFVCKISEFFNSI